ncbi:hypothetical protein WS83_03150 [Burkholderia sp. MSMB2042]|nr:hypothetical protein WS78_26360 [Burkholderia savannae]KVG44258.1 hypothetical protein WS77_10020 [Burkholderia sp. MSMB0265]KVG87786.1 hypothetical protein WS81_26005 [Burkholderia sp. MSMB2040]KVG96371.1 hypothetical protein WS83_03150 [Burkholderia sp. MSMB2042]KVG97187.1 hypothetical protein WS82_30230 [Burkholderia sp. MSMB2041]
MLALFFADDTGLSSTGWISLAAGASGCGGSGAFGMLGLLIESQVVCVPHPEKTKALQIGDVLWERRCRQGVVARAASAVTERPQDAGENPSSTSVTGGA